MHELLLELYCEEIPALMQHDAQNEFQKLYESMLAKYDLTSTVNVYIGVCRIVVHMRDLPDVISIIHDEIKGPKVTAHQNAINGFLSKYSLNGSDIKIFDDIEHYYSPSYTEVKNITDVLIGELLKVMMQYVWPKSMRWGKSDMNNTPLRWIRPIRSILCLYDDQILPISLGSSNSFLEASNITHTHKFVGKRVTVTSIQDYFSQIRKGNVILDLKERESIIQNGLKAKCDELNVVLHADDTLLHEVSGLAEYPVVLHGKIDDKFMILPPEVLITSMRIHQKYFASYYTEEASRSALSSLRAQPTHLPSDPVYMRGNDMLLSPYFLFVSNAVLDDYSGVIAGNQKVISARLSDALFFFENDLKISLCAYKDRLRNVIFHTKIGDLYDKTCRLEAICTYIDHKNSDLIRAASLSKCDLVTSMVTEFTELQGVVGSYYAAYQNESEVVVSAIRNQYKFDVYSKTDALLIIADRIDSLVGLYIAGERSSGSKDPYSLRRYAISVIKIIIDNRILIDIKNLVQYVQFLYKNDDEGLFIELIDFVKERLRQYLRSKYSVQVVSAVSYDSMNIVQIVDLVSCVHAICEQKFFTDIVLLYKRANNLITSCIHSCVQTEDKLTINDGIFECVAESELYQVLIKTYNDVFFNVQHERYEEAIRCLCLPVSCLELFFREVTIVTDDHIGTINRIALLKLFTNTCNLVLNFDELQQSTSGRTSNLR